MGLDLEGGIFLWWGSMRGWSSWAPQHHGTTAKCHLLGLEKPHVVPVDMRLFHINRVN